MMQTLFRAVVMLASLGAGMWALVEYGPQETVQPLARRAIELADEWIGQASATVAQDSLDAPSPGELPTTRLVAEPQVGDMTSISAPPLTPLGDSPQVPGVAKPYTTPVRNDADTPAAANQPDALAPLIALGVQNLKLAQWGGEGRLHRVSGDMPVGNHGSMLRHVEAVAQEPAAAVADVERQVLAWQLQDQRVARLP